MHECDIKINDISVSRRHANLKFTGDAFYLDDNNSKFGTLIEISEPVILPPDEPLCLQIGRTVLTLLVKTPKREKLVEAAIKHEEGYESRRHTQIELDHGRDCELLNKLAQCP